MKYLKIPDNKMRVILTISKFELSCYDRNGTAAIFLRLHKLKFQTTRETYPFYV